jgi:hypothetical protein
LCRLWSIATQRLALQDLPLAPTSLAQGKFLGPLRWHEFCNHLQSGPKKDGWPWHTVGISAGSIQRTKTCIFPSLQFQLQEGVESNTAHMLIVGLSVRRCRCSIAWTWAQGPYCGCGHGMLVFQNVPKGMSACKTLRRTWLECERVCVHMCAW